MTVSNLYADSSLYTGNGVTTAFSTRFAFSSNSDVEVYLVTIADGTETLQTLTTHYTVTGAGTGSAGTVTFVSAPSSSYYVKIRRNTPFTQTVDYVEATSFPAATHEEALDKLTRIAQEMDLKIDRAPLLKLSSSNFPVEFPDGGSSNAGKIIRWDSVDGSTLEAVSSTEAALASSLTPTDGGFVVGDGSEFTVETGATARSSLGLSAMATMDPANVAITGGSIAGITDLAVTDGGTGASSAPDARTNLGLVIGTDVHAYDAKLATLSTNYTKVSSSNADKLDLYEQNTNGSNKVTLAAPASIATDYTFTLPNSPGTSGYSLTTDGSGNTSWTSVSGGGGSPGGANTYVQYNSSGSFGGDSGFVYTGSGAAQLTGSLIVGGNSTASGYVELREDTDNGSNYIRIASPSAVTANTTLTLPDGAGSSNQVLTTNGSGTLSWTTPSTGGAWTYISTATASSSASLSFTGLSSTYKLYVAVIESIVPATDGAIFWLRTSTDNGATYDSGASNYLSMYIVEGSGSSSGSSAADTKIVLHSSGTGIGNATGEGASGIVYVFNPSAVARCRVRGELAYNNTSGTLVQGTIAGVRDTAADVDAIQFLMSTGNIASGSIHLFGVKNA